MDLADQVLGTCLSESAIIWQFDLAMDADELLEYLESKNVEKCPFCEWWYESWELIDDDCNVVGCPDCR